MRLQSRYVTISVGCFLLLLTYEVYIYSGGSAKGIVQSLQRDRAGFIDDYDLIHRADRRIFRGSQRGQHNSVHKHKSRHLYGAEILYLRPPQNVTITAEVFQSSPDVESGNPLIDDYGTNDGMRTGEKGRGVTFVGEEKKNATILLEKYRLNVMASDLIPLNRMVPDSRPPK